MAYSSRNLLVMHSFLKRIDQQCLKVLRRQHTCDGLERPPPGPARFGRYETVRPWPRSPPPPALWDVPLPEYLQPGAQGWPAPALSSPPRLGPSQVSRLSAACQLARSVLAALLPLAARPGTTTESLAAEAERLVRAAGAYPSPLGYRGFPSAICTSVNDVACHGIPDRRPLQDGDIVNIDVTVFLCGYHGDCSDTVLVGSVDRAGRSLVEATHRCLATGIAACGPGRPYAGIGEAIEKTADEAGFCVVPAFAGHGIGTFFHGPPDILHFRNSEEGLMQPGEAFTVEPVLAQGSPEVELLEDGWTAVMADGGRAAQAEHTVLVTDTGVSILTHS